MEKRQFTRVPFEAVARVRMGNAHFDVALLDISLNGALIQKPSGFIGNTEDNVSINLMLDGSEVNIKMQGSIAHLSNGCIGVKCSHMDLDSVTHLRRLVELNLGNPELLDRELAMLRP